MCIPQPSEQLKAQAVIPNFSPQKMVDWLNPLELARIGGRVVLASIFGSYADKREVQAALYNEAREDDRYLRHSDMWFDYIADVGDGFHSTYTLAYLLSQPHIAGGMDGSVNRHLKRGRLLLFGGDQVYPMASREAYRDRMIGPYSWAFPELRRQADEDRLPDPNTCDLYAIPGNHDWYDGLTSFVRTFCQERTLGAWQTRQRRSYFSIPLPHDWWIWGIDIQLEADIDHPQLQYFESVAAQMHACAAQPKLILLTAEPARVYCGRTRRARRVETNPDGFKNLEFFLTRTVERHELDLRLVISGDLHHYARYTVANVRPGMAAERDASQVEFKAAPVHFVTAGGGGAYLSATHHLFEEIGVPVGVANDGTRERTTVTFHRKKTYPSQSESKQRACYCLLPKWSVWFGLLMGFVYLLFTWQLQSSSRTTCMLPTPVKWESPSQIVLQCWAVSGPTHVSSAELVDTSLMDALLEKGLGFRRALALIIRSLGEAPAVFVEIAVFGLLLFGFCAARPTALRILVTCLHVTMHFSLAGVVMWISAVLVRPLGCGGASMNCSYYTDGWRPVLAGLTAFGIGGFIGTGAFALYLFLCAHLLPGAPHMNEVFSAQAIMDCKHFLRFHLGPDGRIRVYVVAVPCVARRWKAATQTGSIIEPREELVTQIVESFTLDRNEQS